MQSTYDHIIQRRLPIAYFSPAVCDADFSSTSEPSIVLEPFSPLRGPTGLVWEWDGDNVRLRWTSFPGALCYSVYRAVDSLDPFGEYVLVAECTEDTEIVLPPGVYRVTAITEEGETEPFDPVRAIAEEPPIPEDPCAPYLGEDTSAVPESFELVENNYEIVIPNPFPHLDFNIGYVHTHINIPVSIPSGDGWSIDLTRVNGRMTATDGVGETIYSLFGLQAYVNDSPAGARIATCDSIGYNEVAMLAAVDAGGYSLQESAVSSGDSFGLGINLQNVSWGDGQLGVPGPPDDPYYDRTQECVLFGGTSFSGANSITIGRNLRMNVRLWRDTTPAISRARVIDLPAFQSAITNPPATLAGPFGPGTYAFTPISGTEWDGDFNCSDSSDSYWEMKPDDCDGYPTIFDLTINGYEVSDMWLKWLSEYVDQAGNVVSSPAWAFTIFIRDVNWGSEFIWWTGVKLTGKTPAGTYLVWNRDPEQTWPLPPAMWPNEDQTVLFAPELACIQVELI